MLARICVDVILFTLSCIFPVSLRCELPIKASKKKLQSAHLKREYSLSLSLLPPSSTSFSPASLSPQQYTSSSSGGESSCEEGRMRRPTHLRPFHHRGDADSDLPLLRLSSDPDEYSSSEQSCDTVIYVGPNGAAVSDRELTDNEGPPEFVPIIPALLRGKAPEPQQAQNQAAGAQSKVI